MASANPFGALAGTEGGRLIAMSAADGTQLATWQLPSPPILDGMAATAGRLYLATVDGNVHCLAGK